MHAQRYTVDETDPETFVNITHLKSTTNTDNGITASYESCNFESLATHSLVNRGF